jgi:hypothetical protein
MDLFAEVLGVSSGLPTPAQVGLAFVIIHFLLYVTDSILVLQEIRAL